MQYATFTATPREPAQEYRTSDGISGQGVLTLVLIAAIGVVVARSSRKARKEEKTGLPSPGKSAPTVPMGKLPEVSMEDLRGTTVGKSPEVPTQKSPGSVMEKGASLLGAPAAKALASQMDIPYELAQRLQKGAWAAMCSARKLPGLERGDVEKTPYGVAVHVCFRGSLDFPTVQRGLGQLETGLDTETGALRLRSGSSAGKGVIDIRLRDPLADGVPWEQPTVPVRLAHPLRLAKTPFGDEITLDVKQRIGIFGTSGSGKSCAQRVIGAHVAQAIDAELEIWDLKFGIESQHYAGKAHRVTTIDDAVDRLDWLMNVEYPRRASKMKERGVSMWDETPWDKALVIIIDEGNVVVRDFAEWRPEAEEGEPREAKGAPLKNLFTLVEQGRALGVYFVWATQYPKAVSLPTEIRSQLNATVCMKLKTSEEAAVVFKDDVREGWAPHDLMGPGWLLVKDDVNTQPVDAKAVWLSVDTFRAVPVSGPSPDKPSLPARAPGQHIYGDGFGQSRTETAPDTDTDSETVSMDKGTGQGSVSEDIWAVLAFSSDCPGVSELARRTGRAKSSVLAALRKMEADCQVVQDGAGYRLRKMGEG